MSDTVVGCRTGSLLADVHTVVDDLLGAAVGADTDSEILDSLRESERVIRRMTAVQHALVLQIEQRGAGYTYGGATTAAVLATALRVDGTEASARVRAAEAAGPRRDTDGQAIPPIYPAVAAGQAAGVVSARQAQVIVQCVERLPGEVQAVHGTRIEAELVAYAGDFAPHHLGKLAIRYLAYLGVSDGLCKGLRPPRAGRFFGSASVQIGDQDDHDYYGAGFGADGRGGVAAADRRAGVGHAGGHGQAA